MNKSPATVRETPGRLQPHRDPHLSHNSRIEWPNTIAATAVRQNGRKTVHTATVDTVTQLQVQIVGLTPPLSPTHSVSMHQTDQALSSMHQACNKTKKPRRWLMVAMQSALITDLYRQLNMSAAIQTKPIDSIGAAVKGKLNTSPKHPLEDTQVNFEHPGPRFNVACLLQLVFLIYNPPLPSINSSTLLLLYLVTMQINPTQSHLKAARSYANA